MYKIYKNLLCTLLLALLLISSTAQAANQPVPTAVQNMTADAAILLNPATNEVLFEKNADKREYPASLTKMMTCILSLESFEPDKIVIISSSAADIESSRVRVGQEIHLASLTRQMMLISDNGAARAIAETLGGSTDNFARMMNEQAKAIGAVNTHFTNPSGMPNPQHYSTARDLAKIAAYGMQNPAFRKIVGTDRQNIFYLKPSGYKVYCENTNELLSAYPGITGIKTGWTRAAGSCLAVSAKRGNTELIAVVLKSSTTKTRFNEAAALLDYGFSCIKTISAN